MFRNYFVKRYINVITKSILCLGTVIFISACGTENGNSQEGNNMLEKQSDRLVYCWGDSITQGMGYDAGQAYPRQLEKFLGEGYDVKNAGDGGEDSDTIMARMGINKMYTASEILFAEGELEKKIGIASNTGLCTVDGRNIMITAKMGYEISCEQVKIAGKSYKLELRDFVWNNANNPIQYTCYLTRTDGNAVTIPKGTEVVFETSNLVEDAYCNVVLVGANDTNKDVESLLAQYKKIVNGLGEDSRYFIIIPYWENFSKWTLEDDEKFTNEFGEHAINFRHEAIYNGVDYHKLPVTQEEIDEMNLGFIPAALCYGNKNNVHLNEKGYEFLAYCIWQQGIKLGYWQ